MSYEQARSIAAVVAFVRMIVAIPLAVRYWIRAVRHVLALQGLRSQRVKASDPDAAQLAPDDRAHVHGLLREAGYFALCVLPPIGLALLFGLT